MTVEVILQDLNGLIDYTFADVDLSFFAGGGARFDFDYFDTNYLTGQAAVTPAISLPEGVFRLTYYSLETGSVTGDFTGNWPAPLTISEIGNNDAWVISTGDIEIEEVTIISPFNYRITIDFNGAGPTVRDFVENWTEQDLVALNPLVNGEPVSPAPSTPPIIDGGTPTSDTITGDSGNDTLGGAGGADVINAGAGDDSVTGGIGFDTVDAGDGNDTVIGQDGYDSLLGGAGDDSMTGNNGFDFLDGGAGNDSLYGGLGLDTLLGGDGADFLSGQAGFDSLDGGAGNDTLQGNAGADTLEGGLGNDSLDGGINNDLLMGGDGADSLNGNNGADSLLGNDGDDILQGNAGSDTLDGGTGNDILRGGIGADTFVFTVGSGADIVIDFQNTVDAIQLDAALMAQASPVADDLRGISSLNADGNLLLDFGNGDTLTFNNVTNTGAILDEVVFV